MASRIEDYALIGDCESAASDYRSLFDDPRHADDALYFAAWCEQQLGDFASARAHLAKYLERFPHGAHAADIKKIF